MNDLAINIEYLLLTRNCVIVPGLGAFTTRVFASQWLEDEELFLPPVRHIHFNADVFQDPEEVFLRSLSEIYGLTEEEAVARCREMVSEFHKSLVTEGTVDFGCIGLFTLEDDAEITMMPYECGVTTPEYYGFDTLHFPLLANTPDEVATEEQVASDVVAPSEGVSASVLLEGDEAGEASAADSHKHIVMPKSRTYVADSKHIIIRLNRAMVHYTMVAAASVLLFFLLGPGVNDERAAEGVRQATSNVVFGNLGKTSETAAEKHQEVKAAPQVADTLTASSVTAVAAAEEPSAEEVNVQEAPVAAAEQSAEVKVQQANETSQVISEIRGSYSVVLASSISLKNAKAFVERLEAKDVHAIIYDNGKMLRVIIDGFASQADAYNVNNYLHNLDADLKSTWVMKN